MREVTSSAAWLSFRFSFLLTRRKRDLTLCGRNGSADPLISTHTPHAGRDVMKENGALEFNEFLLTRPMRDVTV